MKQLTLFLALLGVSLAVDSQLVTLYKYDPIGRTLSFSSGQYGLVFGSNRVLNQDSQIDFGWYTANGLTVGIQGGQTGRIVDLGTQSDLATRYGYSETVGKGQGYSSIQLSSNTTYQLLIRDQSGGLQTLNESSLLGNVSSQDYWVPSVDHIALVRLKDDFDPLFEVIVKMLVVALDYESVTFRYDVLRDTSSSTPPSALTEPFIKTLYALDPNMRTLSLSNGLPGLCFCGYTPECDFCAVCNCYSDLDFNWYSVDELSSGVEGGRKANWVDLGSNNDIASAYPGIYDAFPAIEYTNNTSTILRIDDGTTSAILNARNETTLLYQPAQGVASQSITIGNLYLVRITDSFDPAFERVALIMVLHHTQEVEVTIRYRLLRDSVPEQVRSDPFANMTFVSTLYGRDPLTRSYDLEENRDGAVFDIGNVYNRNGMIDFDNYLQDCISAGIQGGQLAVMIDLGTETAIKAAYLPNSLRDPWTELYLNNSIRQIYFITPQSYINLVESPLLFANSTINGYISLNVYQGHVYLLRLYDTFDPTFERIFKILVLDYVSGEKLTIRWLWMDKFESSSTTTTAGALSSSSDGSILGISIFFTLILLVAAFA